MENTFFKQNSLYLDQRPIEQVNKSIVQTYELVVCESFWQKLTK